MALIPEIEAAKIARCTPATLREKVKSGAWAINYNSRNGRKYCYDPKDLKKLNEAPHEIITGRPDRFQRHRAKKADRQHVVGVSHQ